jgi:succinylglutamate desuccinylase
LQRLIGHYTGQERGTLIIAIAAIHGNELAGMRALRTLFQMLEDEPQRNAGFTFRGRLVGLVGNVQAAERQLRFVKKDLNRLMTHENLKKARLTPPSRLIYEDLEMLELIQTIKNEIFEYKPSRLVVLDLHTTSAGGGIFSVVSDDVESLDLAKQLNAPVVLGMMGNTGGTTLHYFTTENMGIPTISVAFEAGQHTDALSLQRTVSWLVNTLRGVKAVEATDVEHRHDMILKNHSRHLPKVVDLFYVHRIQPNDGFQMREGFKNFQALKAGDVLADDKNGEIITPEDCLLLMPLYQRQGTEGFFLVKDRTK